jgi:hypothetical protein
LKKNQEVTEDFIANIRYQFKVAYFNYKKKKAKWLTIFNKVNSLVETPIKYEDRDLQIPSSQQLSSITLDDLVLKPKPNSIKKMIAYRFLAFLSLLFCLLVLVTEATIIADPSKTLVYFVIFELLTIQIVIKNSQYTFLVVAFTILFLSGITLVCFFTIFSL